MDVVDNDPAGAQNELAALLSEPRAWVVVFGDQSLAGALDAMAGGPLRGVILAPATAAVLARVAACGGEGGLGSDTRAAAISAASGQIVDVLRAGDPVDETRMFELFVRAESQ
jgi:hypothetical protein